MKGKTWLSFLTTVTVFMCIGYSKGDNRTAEGRLIADLTRDYDPRSRPRLNSSESVDVTFAFYLTRLDEVNLRKELLSVTGWMVIRWMDELMTWNPSEYNDLRTIILPTSSVWMPMVALDNSVLNIIEKSFRQNFNVIVHYSGQMSWEPAGVFATSCDVDLAYYPFDHQTCTMYFSTWDYTMRHVNLLHATDTVDMDAYVENGEWDIVYSVLSNGTFSYACCPDDLFPEVSVSLHMRRKSLYYFINILIPCGMMSCLVLVVFHLPPDSGEKVSLGVTVLLAFSVFQLMIAEDMPTSANATPILEVYLLCFMAASIFSIIISVLVLNLHHRTEYTPPPDWLRRLVLDMLGHWLFMGTRRVKTNAVRPVASDDVVEKVEAKIDFENTLDHLSTQPSFPKIVLPNSPVESTEEFMTTGYNLAASGQNLTTGAARSAVRLIQSIANIEKSPKTESKTAFICAVKDVYQELYNTRMAGEVEAALENEWKLIARVVDRFFFWVTFTLLIVSSAVVFGVIPNHEQHLV